MPIRKDFSIIKEIKYFMIVIFFTSISRNVVQIFVSSQKDENIVYTDKILFYIQTGFFILTVSISLVHPYLMQDKMVLPLPVAPECMDNLDTTLKETRSFNAFYDFIETYKSSYLRYINCYCRIRFYKQNFVTEEESSVDQDEILNQVREISVKHLRPNAEESVIFDSSSVSMDQSDADSVAGNKSEEPFHSLQTFNTSWFNSQTEIRSDLFDKVQK